MLYFPDDIFNEILDAVAYIEPAGQPTRNRDHQRETWQTLGWIRLTHVCRRWRYIGLNRPSLWASVVTNFPRASEIMIARAKNAPFTLRLDLYNFSLLIKVESFYPDFLENILALVPRSRVIHDAEDWESVLRGRARNWGDILQGQTLPLLESLNIANIYNRRTALEPLIPDNPFFAPNLRLYKIGYFIPFVAHSLRVLEIKDSRLSWKRCLNILETCPLLVELSLVGGLWSSLGEKDAEYDDGPWMPETVLDNSLSALYGASESSSRTVHLTELKKLRLVYCGCEAYMLLQHLSFPMHTAMTIGLCEEVPFFRHIVSLVKARLCLPSMGLLSISSRPFAAYRDDPYVSFNVAHNTIGWKWPAVEDVGVTTQLNFSRAFTTDRASDITLDMLMCLPAEVHASIRTLAVSGDYCEQEYRARAMSPESDFDRWIALLQRYSGVSTLFYQPDAHPIFSRLMERPSSDEMLLPNLHTIIVHRNPEGMALPRAWWDGFKSWLVMRRAEGCPIKRVVLTGCSCHLVDEGYGENRVQELKAEVLRDLVDEVVDERDSVEDDGECTCNDW
ncbi:hypothetical protein PENSPDRAFT_656753 [Peniophora sp. CONT]|nr:hypothetical protein PENSPDRAFT_656753 [Peniophora sp. CONT]